MHEQLIHACVPETYWAAGLAGAQVSAVVSIIGCILLCIFGVAVRERAKARVVQIICGVGGPSEKREDALFNEIFGWVLCLACVVPAIIILTSAIGSLAAPEYAIFAALGGN